MKASISSVRDLSPTAREVMLTLPEPLQFTAGAFINLFIEKDGKRERRAYSISSDPKDQKHISLSIRRTHSPTSVSSIFWRDDITEQSVDIMGPLGLNTADKIIHTRVFLFGFGIGVSVVKGLTHELLFRKDIREVTVVTGSRTEDEILYKDFFDALAKDDARLKTRYVVSRPRDASYPYQGYVSSHIDEYDYTGATIYICGQSHACKTLQDALCEKGAHGAQFFIEAFDG